jgi:hypothetical protein
MLQRRSASSGISWRWARGRSWCHCLKTSFLLRIMDSDPRFKRVQGSLGEEVEE